MRNKVFSKVCSVAVAACMGAVMLAGCGSEETAAVEGLTVEQVAENYVKAGTGEDLVYNDANGWSVKYDPSVITVNGGGPVTTFVYTGECAGTNMITVTYDVDKDAKTAIADMAKSWGEDAETHEAPFPGAEDITGYWATLAPSADGSGMYETALARDYMDGYLVFEITGHNGTDEEMNMAVSDTLASIIDSLQFS